jgi:hypothetical protein
MEMMLILFDMKQMEDRAKLLDQRNSYLDCFCMANEFLHSFPIVVCVKHLS